MGWKSVPKGGGGGDKKAASQLYTNKSAQQTAEQFQIASKICTTCDLGRLHQGRNMVARVHKYNVIYINTGEEIGLNRGRAQRRWCRTMPEMSDETLPYIFYERKNVSVYDT